MGKIYLFDDGNNAIVEALGTNFRSAYPPDRFCYIQHLSLQQKDFIENELVNEAACILLHKSFTDYDAETGCFIEGSQGCCAKISEIQMNDPDFPFVFFSNMFPNRVEYDEEYTPMQIDKINKTLFYQRLKPFLDHYMATGEIAMKLLAEGAPADATPVSRTGTMMVFGEAEEASPQLARALEGSQWEYHRLPDSHHQPMQRDGEWEQLLENYFAEKIEGKVIDTLVFDAPGRHEASRAIEHTLFVRLSLGRLKSASLLPILLATPLSLRDLLTDPDNRHICTILATPAFDVAPADDAPRVASLMQPMKVERYVNDFLRVIKLNPLATEGHHSVANIWGAEALWRVIGSGKSKPVSDPKVHTAYFKYAFLSILSPQVIDQMLNGQQITTGGRQITVEMPQELTDMKRTRRWLLIDDEWERGWHDVLQKLLPAPWKGDHLTNQEIGEFIAQGKIPERMRQSIARCEYQLVFLDLRLSERENISHFSDVNSFSGMKMLRAIKKINRGTQVIILTASNKVWNIQALLDAGANGYYIKESPEARFTIDQTAANAQAFSATITRCLSCCQYPQIYATIEQIKAALLDDRSLFGLRLREELRERMKGTEMLLAKSRHVSEFRLAYFFLEQCFELIANHVLTTTDSRTMVYALSSAYAKAGTMCGHWNIAKDGTVWLNAPMRDKQLPIASQITSIYLQFLTNRESKMPHRVKDEESVQICHDISDLVELRNAVAHADDSTTFDPVDEADIERDKADIFELKCATSLILDYLLDMVNAAVTER